MPRKDISYYLNHKYVKHFNWYFISGLLLYGVQFLANSYLTKHFTLDEYSTYALILSICSPVFLFFNMNIRVLTTTKGKVFSKSAFSLFRIVSLVTAFIIASSISFFILDASSYTLFVVLALFRSFDGLFEWSYGYFLKSEYSSKIGMSQIYRSLALGIPIVIGILFFKPSMVQFFIMTLAGLGVVFFSYDILQQTLVSYKWISVKNFINLFKVGLPLGLVALFDSLAVQIPKYALEYYDYSDFVGVFTSLFVFIQTMSYTGFAIVNSTLPSLSTYIENKNRKAVSNLIVKSSIIMFSITVCFILGVYVLGGWVLNWVYTPEIATHQGIFVIMSMFTLPMQLASVFAYALYGFGKFNTYLIISCVSTFTGALLAIYYVSELSILGAVIAFGIAMTLKCILVWVAYLRARRELV